MNSINLLPKESQTSSKILAVRKWTILLTTICLVIYIVGAAGLVGWWLFLASMDSVTTKNLQELQTAIQQNSATESLVWQVNTRQANISTFLTERIATATIASTLPPKDENILISTWKYSVSGQLLTVSVQQNDQLEKYTERLKQNFPNIAISQLVNKGDQNWNGDIKL